MQGKTVIVTGANSGIGLAAAKNLAGQGAHIVMACRNEAKANAAREEIVQSSGSDKVDVMLMDCASLESLRNFASEFKRKYDRLDVLLNNAGMIIPDRRKSEDGFELNFAVNHLGYFVPTFLLMDMIKAAPAGRVVSVSSMGHRLAGVNFDDLQWERRPYIAMLVYGASKRMNILFTVELARQLAGTKATANCLHPGAVGSEFGQKDSGWFNGVMRLGKSYLITPEQGARTSVYLASSPDVEGVSGQYFYRRKPGKAAKAALNPTDAERLWQVSQELCAL